MLNDVTRKRKAFIAVGRKPFAEFLKKISVPQRYIGNYDFWNPSTIQETLKEVRSNAKKQNVDFQNRPLVNRLRHQTRKEKRAEDSQILLPFNKEQDQKTIKSPWASMRLRERKPRAAKMKKR